MRAIKSVLIMAGQMKRRYTNKQAAETPQMDEYEETDAVCISQMSDEYCSHVRQFQKHLYSVYLSFLNTGN